MWEEESTASSVATIEGPGRAVALDRHLIDCAYRALRARGYGQLLKLKVSCDHGRVTLQGCVPTYYLKQVAQSVLKPIDGIRDVDNDVQVRNGK